MAIGGAPHARAPSCISSLTIGSPSLELQRSTELACPGTSWAAPRTAGGVWVMVAGRGRHSVAHAQIDSMAIRSSSSETRQPIATKAVGESARSET